MEFEESIYNLIPKDAYIPPKEKRHQSKHDPLSAPSSSTFCLNTTSKPGLANVAGVNAPSGSNHVNIGGGNTFGLPKGWVATRESWASKHGEPAAAGKVSVVAVDRAAAAVARAARHC